MTTTTIRYVTNRELPLIDLIDGSESFTIGAGECVLAATEAITTKDKMVRTFTVLTGPHTSKEFVIDAYVFLQAFDLTA